MAATGLLNPSHVIYALSTDGSTYRYVGFTGKKIRQRLSMHRWEAKHGNSAPLYDWFREEGPDNVTATVLEKMPTDTPRELLGEREARWIAVLREEGYALINQAAGGLGVPGVRPTVAQLEARAERGRRQDLSHLHNAEMQARATAARTGQKRGSYNWSPSGAANSAEGRAKASHNRWHVARGLVKEGCTHCAI
jgi:hypothetical protein